jgi:hypothetical protein
MKRNYEQNMIMAQNKPPKKREAIGFSRFV